MPDNFDEAIDIANQTLGQVIEVQEDLVEEFEVDGKVEDVLKSSADPSVVDFAETIHEP